MLNFSYFCRAQSVVTRKLQLKPIGARPFHLMVAVSFLAIVFTFVIPETAHTQDGLTGGVYLANKGQIARSRNFYDTSPHWENVTGELPVPIPGSAWGGITEFTLNPFDPLNRAWVSLGDPQWSRNGSVWHTENLDDQTPAWTEILSEEQINTATGLSNPRVWRIKASTLQSGLIFIVVTGGGKTLVGRSDDYGSTWTWSHNIGTAGPMAVGFALSEHDVNRLWVGASVPGRLLVSNDGGRNFIKIYEFPGAYYQPKDIFVPTRGNVDDQIIYAVAHNGPNDYLYRSLNSGHNWEDITHDNRYPRGTYNVIGGNIPGIGDIFYVSYIHDGPWHFMYSSDGGNTWDYRYNTSSHTRSAAWQNPVTGHLYTARPNSTLSKLDSVAFYSNDGGRTWKNKTGDWFDVMGLPYLGEPGSSGGTAPVIMVDANALQKSCIVQESDDAGPAANACSFSLNHNEIYFGECSNGQGIVSGFRFQNIPISSPEKIESAFIEFTVDGPYSNDIHIAFRGEDVDSSHTFSDASKPSDRQPLTSHIVEWNVNASDVWNVRENRNSPDLTPIIKEIVARPGWKTGNAISIIVENVASNGNHRRVFAFEREGNSAHAARLVVNFGHSISGQVAESANSPLSGVIISEDGGRSATTNSDGNYILRGLAAGTYNITPSKSGYTFSPPSRTVTVPPNAAGVDFYAESPGGHQKFPKPSIISRTEWDCPDGQQSRRSPEYKLVTHLIIHETTVNEWLAGAIRDNNYSQTVRNLWCYGAVLKNSTEEDEANCPKGSGAPEIKDVFGDIAYNYVIDPNANIYEGRAGGDNAVGAHFSGENWYTMGVALIGQFGCEPLRDVRGHLVEPTPRALTKLIQLLAWKCDQLKLNPMIKTRHEDSGKELYTISGHRDIGDPDRACDPGVTLDLDETRLGVRDYLARFRNLPFTDVNGGARALIEEVYFTGLMPALTNSPLTFGPGNQVKRGEAAKFLLRAIYGKNYSPPLLPEHIFSDMINHEFETWAEELYRKGFTLGCGSNPLRFCPDKPLSRAQMAELMGRAIYGTDFEPPDPTEQIFDDVPVSEWYAKWVNLLKKDGYLKGCDQDGSHFCPNAPVTRAQMAEFIRTIHYHANYCFCKVTVNGKLVLYPPSPECDFCEGDPTSVTGNYNIPSQFALHQSYPNPFNPATAIEYDLPQTVQVQLLIYNILGQHVKTLIDEHQQAGFHAVSWNGKDENGSDVAAGLYIYRIIAGRFIQTRKMLLLR